MPALVAAGHRGRRQSDRGEGPGDAGVGEQNEGQKKTFSIGLGEGKEKQRAEVMPALVAAGPRRRRAMGPMEWPRTRSDR